MPNTIVYANSFESGAPTLHSTTAGSLTDLLYALLVTGWGLQTVTSVSVSGGVATVTKAGHGLTTKRMVDVAGATPTELNGRQFITVVDANTFTFAAPGVADGAASGTITVKRSALGWARTFHSGNVSIFSRTDPTATPWQLRVDDSAASYIARCRAVLGATDINTWTKQAPTELQFAGGQYIYKGANTASNKHWALIGDSRTMYLFVQQPGSTSGWDGNLRVLQLAVAFGDVAAFRAGDSDACLMAARPSSTTSAGGVEYGTGLQYSPSGLGPFFVMCGSLTGYGDPPQAAVVTPHDSGHLGSIGLPWPNPANNGLVVRGNIPVTEAYPGASYRALRGWLRGVAEPLLNTARVELQLQEFDSVSGSDRRWLSVIAGSTTAGGCMAFDLTGPWA